MTPGTHSRLPEPKKCDHCNSKNIVFRDNALMGMKGKPFSFWFCNCCYAMVSCHERTRFPVGYMTDKKGRRMRKELHAAFDILWMRGYMSRNEAYEWLAIKLLKTRAETHISQLTKDEMIYALEICKKEVETLQRIEQRRQAKESEKRIKSYERTRKQIRIRKSTESNKSFR